jgi:hypothetical protein
MGIIVAALISKIPKYLQHDERAVALRKFFSSMTSLTKTQAKARHRCMHATSSEKGAAW